MLKKYLELDSHCRDVTCVGKNSLSIRLDNDFVYVTPETAKQLIAELQSAIDEHDSRVRENI